MVILLHLTFLSLDLITTADVTFPYKHTMTIQLLLNVSVSILSRAADSLADIEVSAHISRAVSGWHKSSQEASKST